MASALAHEQPEELLSSASELLATSAELRLLSRLREELAHDLAEAPVHEELVGDIRLLRSLRAFGHDVREAAARFREHLAMRRHMGLDAVRDRVLRDVGGHDRLWDLTCDTLPHGAEVNRYMPEVAVFSRSDSGDPVCLGIWGKGRPRAFMRDVDGWRDKFAQYFLYLSEARALLLDQASRQQGRLAHFVQVLDLEDWSVFSHLDRAWAAYSTEVTLPLGETYHDFNSFFICIRAGRLVPAAWATTKRLLPKKVAAKVVILGNRFFESAQAHDILGASTVELLVWRRYLPIASRRSGNADRKYNPNFAKSSRSSLVSLSAAEDSGQLDRAPPLHDTLPFPRFAVTLAFVSLIFSLALALRM